MKDWDFLRDCLLRATGKDLSGTGKCFSRAIVRRIGTLQNNTLNLSVFYLQVLALNLLVPKSDSNLLLFQGAC